MAKGFGVLISTSLEIKNAQKALDNFLKQKVKLGIDVDIPGLDKVQTKIKQLEKTINGITKQREKLDKLSGGSDNSKQEELLQRLEKKEKDLAVKREQFLKDYSKLQEQITQERLNALARIEAEERKNAAQQQERINKQAEQFKRMYGTLQEDLFLPTTGGIDGVTKAIKSMDGFSDANVKAIGSAQAGETILNKFITTTKNAGGGFDTYKISVDSASGATYLLNQGLKSTDTAMLRASESTNMFVDSLAVSLIASGVKRSLEEIKEILWDCIEASIEFESALAGVRKTTSFNTTELADLRNELMALSTEIPTTATSLAQIAEKAGQLGVEKDKITDFVRVMADLGVSTNLAGEEAANMFARFANITQMPQEQFGRLGSSIVELGNNLATTESEIGNMALRLASAGKQAGMSEAEILGLSGALSAVGIKAEMGGSAFSKALNKINVAVHTSNDELKDYARVAGMSAEEFAQAWTTNAASAMLSFTEGLADVERHGKNTVVLLDEIGLTEVRLSDALRRAAGSGELFRNSITMSNNAWDENVALTREAGIRYETTESKMQLLANATDQLKIAVGDSLTPAINGATGSLADFTLQTAEFIKENEWLVHTLTVMTITLGAAAGGIAVYSVGIKALAAAKAALAVATGTATKANAGFMTTLVATPLGPVILSLAAVAGAITTVTIAVGENNKAQEEARRIAIDNGNALKVEAEGLEAQKQKVIELHKALADGNLTQADAVTKRTELMSIQDELISKYGSEVKAIDLLGGSVDGLTQKYDSLIESAARAYLTDNASAINVAKEYINKPHNPNKNVGFSAGTKVFFSAESEKQMDGEVQNFIKSLAESLGGKYGFAEKWDWDQWIFGGQSTELRFENATVEQYLDYLRQYSEKIKEFELQTGKDLSQIRGDIADEINSWNNDTYKKHLEVLNKATEAEVTSTYRNQYKAILDAQKEFNQAYAEGDIQGSDKALQGIMDARDNAIAAIGDDASLQDYFNKMVEGQEEAFKKLSWEDVISQNKDLTESFKGLSTDAKMSEWSQEQKDAFEKLRDILNLTSDEDIPRLISALGEMGVLETPVKKTTESLLELSNALSKIESQNSLVADIEKEISETGQVSVGTIEKLQKAGYDLNEVLSVQNGKIVANSDAIRNHNQEMQESIIQAYEDAIATDESTIKINNNTIAIKENEIARLESSGATDSQMQSILNEVEAIKTENTTLQDNIDKNKENIDIMKVYANTSEHVASVLSSLAGELSNISSNYDTVIAAQKQLDETGSITASTLKSLTDNNLLQYLEQTEQGIRFNVAALEADFQALKDNAIATATAAANKQVLALAETYAGTEARSAKPAIDDIGASAKEAGAKAAEGARGLIDFATAAASISGSENLAAFENEYNKVAERLKGTIAGINSLVIGNSSSRGGSGTNSAYEEEKKLIEQKYKSHIITAKEYYDELERLRYKYITDSVKSERIMLENQEKYSKALGAEFQMHYDVLKYL